MNFSSTFGIKKSYIYFSLVTKDKVPFVSNIEIYEEDAVLGFRGVAAGQ